MVTSATPGTEGYRVLKALIEKATRPVDVSHECIKAMATDSTSDGYLVEMRSRTFRTSPKAFAFLNVSVHGSVLRFHPAGARAGIFELRISESLPIAYLTDPRNGRTWVSTLEPFRAARRAGKEASAVAIAAPYDDLDSARRNSILVIRISEWLKARFGARAGAMQGTLSVPVRLSGRVVAGLQIVDHVTGRQLVTLRSHSLRAGTAMMTVNGDSVSLCQDAITVHFPIDDLVGRWGNQLTRNACYQSTEEAAVRSAELRTRRLMARLIEKVLALQCEPGAEILRELDRFSAIATAVRSGVRRKIGLALNIPKVSGCQYARKVEFDLRDFRQQEHFTPVMKWIPFHGLMVVWVMTDMTVAAFGVSRLGANLLGVFQSLDAALDTAARDAALILADTIRMVKKQEIGDDLPCRIARFNSGNVCMRQRDRQVEITNVFSGMSHRFRVSSTQKLWSPKLLMSPGGPLLILYPGDSSRHTPWRVFGPLRTKDYRARDIAPVLVGRYPVMLQGVAMLLSNKLSMPVTAGMASVNVAKIADVQVSLRRAICKGFADWNGKGLSERANLFYEFSGRLWQSLVSKDKTLRRDALLAAEYFLFAKPLDQLLRLYGALFSSSEEVSVLMEGESFKERSTQIARILGSYALDRPRSGMPPTILTRFRLFEQAIAQIGGVDLRSSLVPDEALV